MAHNQSAALFDVVNDPAERYNLIDQPAHADVVVALGRELTRFFDRYRDDRFDLWAGGTAKGILLDRHYSRNDLFRNRFPGWREPLIEKASQPFTDGERP